MIKVTVDELKTQEKEFYPRLMVGNKHADTHQGMVVLFSKVGTGVVVFSDESHKTSMGYISTSFDMTCFDEFNGTITLQNQ
jgi:hypothetical protein